jgi:hypothetical protein
MKIQFEWKNGYLNINKLYNNNNNNNNIDNNKIIDSKPMNREITNFVYIFKLFCILFFNHDNNQN